MQWEEDSPDSAQAQLRRAEAHLRQAKADLELQAATDHLQSSGLRVLDQNWHSGHGKLDIVAAEHRCLVVCQVKTRPARSRAPMERITRAKVRRFRRLAVAWLTANGVLYDEVRIDVIGLTKDPGGGFTIEHVRGVG